MAKTMTAVRRFNVMRPSYQREDDSNLVQVTRGGQPLPGIRPERITSIEEKVMEWTDANHIHQWFVKNVQHGKDDRGSYQVDAQDLRKLLAVCETVLNGTHLVREKVFKGDDHDEIRQRVAMLGIPSMVIRNVSVAHKLLPLPGGDNSRPTAYDKAYLDGVTVTRDWAERMLMDMETGAPRNSIYYQSGW